MAAATPRTVLEVPCPRCGTAAPFDGRLNRWRPFCSERCRQADLGAWASERFRIAIDVPEDDDAPDGPGSR